jgi:hypothetical protein
MESTLRSILGLMILYHRNIARISCLELRSSLISQLPVRQNGWVKDALRVKYFSMVSRCAEGGVWVRRWTTLEISLSTDRSA